MGNAEREAWVTFLEFDVVGKEGPAGHRVYQCVIRVTGGGLQAVIKVRRGEGFYVAFTGAATLPGLAAKVRGVISNPDTMWRDDKYMTG